MKRIRHFCFSICKVRWTTACSFVCFLFINKPCWSVSSVAAFWLQWQQQELSGCKRDRPKSLSYLLWPFPEAGKPYSQPRCPSQVSLPDTRMAQGSGRNLPGGTGFCLLCFRAHGGYWQQPPSTVCSLSCTSPLSTYYTHWPSSSENTHTHKQKKTYRFSSTLKCTF